MKLPAILVNKKILPIALAQGVGLACGVAGVKLASSLVSPEDYGRYGIFLTFTPLGIWLVHAGLIKFTARHWAGTEDRHALWRQIMGTTLRYLPWLGLISAIAAFLLAGSRMLWVLPIVFMSATALSFANLSQTALQADRRHWSDFSVSLGCAISRTFFPLLLYWMLSSTVFALYGGFLLHAVFFCALAMFVAWPRKTSRPVATAKSNTASAMADFTGVSFQILAVAGWMLFGLNRWLVALFYGATAAGHFTLASNIAVILPSMLGTVFTQYFQPEFFAMPHATANERLALLRRVDRVAQVFTILAFTGVLCLCLALPWLVGTLIDARYLPAMSYVFPAGCFVIATTTALFYHQLLLACQRASACLRVDLAFAVVLLIGGLIAAAIGATAFVFWLLLTPVVPWCLNRTLVRRLVLQDQPDLSPRS